uniref:Uncharacterized protein n=1 Tax=Physcomitrium patens TaxID=3218 RepID=A0A2K1K8E2_PHYPA|nr:hypothetical protein PHYPA_011944 [Physcomitrium patens]
MPAFPHIQLNWPCPTLLVAAEAGAAAVAPPVCPFFTCFEALKRAQNPPLTGFFDARHEMVGSSRETTSIFHLA